MKPQNLGLQCEETAHRGPALTNREAKVLAALAAGLGVQGTADALVVSVATVRTHIKHLHQKAGTHSLDQLVAWAPSRIASAADEKIPNIGEA